MIMRRMHATMTGRGLCFVYICSAAAVGAGTGARVPPTTAPSLVWKGQRRGVRHARVRMPLQALSKAAMRKVSQ